MAFWRRKRPDAALQVERVRNDLLSRVALLESKLSRAETQLEDVSGTAQGLIQRDKKVSRLATSVTELEAGFDALRGHVAERIEQLSSSVQAAHRAAGGRTGGKGRPKEATQIGMEVLDAMATAEGLHGLIEQLQRTYATQFGDANGHSPPQPTSV